MQAGKTLNILLIEDNPGDIHLMNKVLSKMSVKNNVKVITDGEEALNYFNQMCGKSESKPDFIILDLNLPKRDGREVLSHIKGNANFKHIPVMILTSSQNRKDVLASYRSYANMYIVKPMDIQEFFKIGQAIESFWFSMCKLPKIEFDEEGKEIL